MTQDQQTNYHALEKKELIVLVQQMELHCVQLEEEARKQHEMYAMKFFECQFYKSMLKAWMKKKRRKRTFSTAKRWARKSLKKYVKDSFEIPNHQ